MRPSLSETASMIFPSTMRPVFERRAIREASSSVRLRKRSRIDMQSLWVRDSFGDRTSDTAIGDLGLLHDHSVLDNPVVFSSVELVLARKYERVVCVCQTARRKIVNVR